LPTGLTLQRKTPTPIHARHTTAAASVSPTYSQNRMGCAERDIQKPGKTPRRSATIAVATAPTPAMAGITSALWLSYIDDGTFTAIRLSRTRSVKGYPQMARHHYTKKTRGGRLIERAMEYPSRGEAGIASLRLIRQHGLDAVAVVTVERELRAGDLLLR
jgi:hypothetical protein